MTRLELIKLAVNNMVEVQTLEDLKSYYVETLVNSMDAVGDLELSEWIEGCADPKLIKSVLLEDK